MNIATSNRVSQAQQATTNLTIDQIQTGTEYCWNSLVKFGEEHKTIAFTTLHKKLGTFIGRDILYPDFETILGRVNDRSWAKLGCMLTSIVTCRNGIPGMRLFYQAKAKGAISFVPQGYDALQSFANEMQERVFKCCQNSSR